MKKFISFSGGVESTTMCILYGADAKAIWADTGAEHKKMYERIDNVEEAIKRIHPQFEIIKVKGKVNHKRINHFNLEKAAIAYKYMPSMQMRYCTKYFKIWPIDKYLKEQGECELMIGLNIDEENSREGNWGLNKNVKYTYPLIDDGLTRLDCEDILNLNKLHPNMPVYMSRGGCRMCFFKTEKEYKAMYFLEREEFMEVVAFEEEIQDRRKTFYSIMGNKSLRQLMSECESERTMFSEIESLYKAPKKETSCGVFCHR